MAARREADEQDCVHWQELGPKGPHRLLHGVRSGEVSVLLTRAVWWASPHTAGECACCVCVHCDIDSVSFVFR